MKNIKTKFKYYFKYYCIKYRELLITIFSMFGIIELIFSILDIYFPNIKLSINLGLKWLIVTIIILLVFSLIKNRPKLQRVFFIKNRDINITIQVGSIFDQKGAKVIPTNTTFDTCMENDFISIKSVQGQFQEKFFKYNLNVLDRMLEDSLIDCKISKVLDDKRKTKINKYECGTVAKIMHNNVRYYFLAVADVNERGKPLASYDDIFDAVQKLWDYLTYNGNMENLVMPIIGTGLTGIADATKMDVIKDIISAFIILSEEKKVTDNLVLCIYPDDLYNNKVNIDEIYEYVEYVSKYKYSLNSKKKIGKPLQ